MLKLRITLTTLILMFLFSIGFAATDDTAAGATPLGYTDTVTDKVSPSDNFDYYTFTVKSGDIITGTITLDSQETGTTIKITDPAKTSIYNLGTTDTVKSLAYTATEPMLEGIYFIRIGFYSAYPYEHNYTLTLNLQPAGEAPQEIRKPQSEELPEPMPLGWGETVEGTLTEGKRLDLWQFTVTDPETEGNGKVAVESEPVDIRLSLYDSTKQELYSSKTENGGLEFGLNLKRSPLPEGDYYIALYLTPRKVEESHYTLTLTRTSKANDIQVAEGITKFKGPIATNKPLMLGVAEIIHPLGPDKSPWPMRRGGSQRRGCSSYKAPSGKAAVVSDLDLSQAIDTSSRTLWGLVAGPNNMVYFIDQAKSKLYGWDIFNGLVWQQDVGKNMTKVCLDGDGKVYAIHPDGGRLWVLNPDGVPWTASSIPGGPGEGLTMERDIWCVGKRIYTSSYSADRDKTYIWAMEKNGFIAWHVSELDGKVGNIAEDPNGSVYVQTGEWLRQYDNYGNERWWWKITPYHFYGNYYPKMFTKNIGPIIGDKGYVYVNDVDITSFRVITADGQFYKDPSGTFDPYSFVVPYTACYSPDKKFYFADYKGRIICCTDWTTEAWSWQIPGDTVRVHDMVMDGNNTLFVNYTSTTGGNYRRQYWVSLDTTKGTAIETQEINLPMVMVDAPGQLAIGGMDRLIYLNRNGRLIVYGPAS